jgi:hypothetical protein
VEDTNKNIVNDLIGKFKSLITPKLILSFDALNAAVYDLVGATDSEKDKNRYFDQLESIKTQKDHLIEVFMNSIDRANNRFIDGNYIYFNIDEDQPQEESTLSLSLIEDNTLDEYLARDNLVSKCEINCNTNLYGLEQRYAKLASLASLKTIELPISPSVMVNSYRNSIDAIQTKLDLDMHFRLMLYIIYDRNVLNNLNEVYNDINEYLVSKGIVKHISFGFNNNKNDKDDEIDLTTQNLSLDEKVETINPNEKISLADIEDIKESSQAVNNMDSSYQLISNILSNKSTNTGTSTNNSTAAGNNNLASNENSGQGSEFNPELSSNNGTHGLNVSSELLEKFNQQTEKLKQSNLGGSVNTAQKKPANVNVLIKILNSLQDIDFSNINLTKKNKSPEEVKNEFIEELSKGNNEVIQNEDMQAIDLIVLLFKYIVDDRNLPDAIQVILSHLQIPYLKIALQDNNLFADKTHPARLLLNELSIASVGWSKEVDEEGVFLDEIKAISQKIVNNQSYSDDYFNELIQEFNTFNKKLNESTQEVQDQTNEKLHKKEKLVQAKKVAAELLINKMTSKKMPKLFKDILLGSWLYILVLTDIKHSRMSDEYKDKVDFINKLIDLAHFSEEVTITKTQIDELLRQYIKGLKLVTFNKEVVRKKLIKLKKQLVDIHFNLDLEATENETESQEIISLAEIQDHELGVVSYIKEEEALSAANENIVVDDASLNLVKSMQIGDWLIFNDLDEDNKTIEAKLSWISPITGKYLFVLASGLIYKDIIPQSIAIGLTDKTMVMVENKPIFDRAMESIANTLQATA